MMAWPGEYFRYFWLPKASHWKPSELSPQYILPYGVSDNYLREKWQISTTKNTFYFRNVASGNSFGNVPICRQSYPLHHFVGNSGLGNSYGLPYISGNSRRKYPSKETGPIQLSVFRLWRDMGYAIGAILTGLIADALGLEASILTIAFLTLTSAHDDCD
jgi:hypothetical protein